MTELGQLLFGAGAGQSYEVPRRSFGELFADFLTDIGADGYGNDMNAGDPVEPLENATFAVRPYWWGDCTCEYEALEDAWGEAHPGHVPGCIAAALRDAPSDAARLKLLRDAEGAEATLMGWGLRCDCAYGAAWAEFRVAHDHDPACRLVLPNFEHFTSGLKIEWYKYPMRGATMNLPLDETQFANILDDCRRAVPLRLAADQST